MSKKSWEEDNRINGILTDYDGNPVNIIDIHPEFSVCDVSPFFADYIESNIDWTNCIEVLPSIKFKIK